MRYTSKYFPKDIDKYDVKIPENKRKSNHIAWSLRSYDVCNARDVIRIIEEQGVDKFNFDYPYGSFEEYKKHVLAGEFDVDVEAHMMTSERREELKQLVREGKLWITY